MMPWLWYALVQICMLLATTAGWVVLIPFSLAQAWLSTGSQFEPNRTIDAWAWHPLNYVYGNPEDGVSGAYARIWKGEKKVPYMPGANPIWRAYCWSALRNNANNLKYVFAWKNGPLYTRSIGKRTLKIGWQLENGLRVPVLSI